MTLDLDSSPREELPSQPLPPAGIRPTGLRYAAIVPLCAALMLIIVIVINVATSSGPAAPKVSPKLQSVSGLSPAPVDPFTKLVYMGEPPDNILDSVVVPTTAVEIGLPYTGGNATSYDRTITFTSSASTQALYTFFYQQIEGRGWKIFSTGAPVGTKGVEILAQKAGTDSWYWEQGVVIHNTVFGANGSQSTTFSVRLYQASEDN